jgi:DNA-directed RNA polymerase subunit RPC12/RpoP
MKPECIKSNESKLLPKEVTCPKCSIDIELDEKERMSERVHCPECEVRIDYSVDPPLVEEPKNYVEIAWSLNQADISLIKSILDDTEIDYHVFGENFLSVDPLIQPARIFVLDEQTILVKDILKDFKVQIVGVSMRDDMTDEG